jgi:hypothetical protein
MFSDANKTKPAQAKPNQFGSAAVTITLLPITQTVFEWNHPSACPPKIALACTPLCTHLMCMGVHGYTWLYLCARVPCEVRIWRPDPQEWVQWAEPRSLCGTCRPGAPHPRFMRVSGVSGSSPHYWHYPLLEVLQRSPQSKLRTKRVNEVLRAESDPHTKRQNSIASENPTLERGERGEGWRHQCGSSTCRPLQTRCSIDGHSSPQGPCGQDSEEGIAALIVTGG